MALIEEVLIGGMYTPQDDDARLADLVIWPHEGGGVTLGLPDGHLFEFPVAQAYRLAEGIITLLHQAGALRNTI